MTPWQWQQLKRPRPHSTSCFNSRTSGGHVNSEHESSLGEHIHSRLDDQDLGAQRSSARDEATVIRPPAAHRIAELAGRLE